jgi:hypothetical protein
MLPPDCEPDVGEVAAGALVCVAGSVRITVVVDVCVASVVENMVVVGSSALSKVKVEVRLCAFTTVVVIARPSPRV